MEYQCLVVRKITNDERFSLDIEFSFSLSVSLKIVDDTPGFRSKHSEEANMPIIDADTHVDETEDTWEYMERNEAQFKPYYQRSKNFDPSRPTGSGHYWIIEGKRQRRRVRTDEATGTTRECRELLDVKARLLHMDQLGVDVHVIYPTLFATEFTETAEVELALRKSYNRWIADRTGQS